MILVAIIGLGAVTRNIHLPAYSYLNGMDEKQSMGNLKEKTWDEIWNNKRAEEVRGMVKSCNKNCWMIGSAASGRTLPSLDPGGDQETRATPLRETEMAAGRVRTQGEEALVNQRELLRGRDVARFIQDE